MRSCPFPLLVIGQMILRDRIDMAAMKNNFSDEKGVIGNRIITYYRERARGGAGHFCLFGIGQRRFFKFN